MTQRPWNLTRQTQYDSLTREVAWVGVNPRTELLVLGRDRVRVVNNFCTADVLRLTPGQGSEAFFLSIKGTTMGHGAIYVAADRIVLSTVPEQGEALSAHFRQFIVSEKVDFEDRSWLIQSYLLAGPEALPTLRRLGVDLHFPERLDHATAAMGTMQVSIRRTDLLGADGFEIVAARELSHLLEEAFATLAIPNCPAEVLEIVRIENRIPKFGVDIDSKNLPQEIGRDRWAISFNKGCYLGQETVARLDSLGHVNRHWVAIEFDGEDVPPAGSVIEIDGKPIARVTSSTWSPKLGKPLALAFVRDSFHSPGQAFATPFGKAIVSR